ncbi:hypothetical protein HDV05_006786 [Chytridiales sp. JEL 0842]|nr:hypothetical protein HDV05_006786 [Chytridiales sp. JEL 0842]
MVETLLRCRRVDVNIPDFESGYTALHQALFDGKLEIALAVMELRPDGDLTIPDKEGNTCLDLLNSTIDYNFASRSRRPAKEDVADDDSNILGHHNSNNRNLAERVDLNRGQQFPVSFCNWQHYQPVIKLAAVSKYHLLIVSDDGVYTNGFGAGGRLGLGHEETTFRPTKVAGVVGHVVYAAVGPDHSVVLTKDGEVWTWGSNKWGQLGYVTEDAASVLSPREVGGPLKRVRIVHAAASKFHTVVVSNQGLVYTWGFNQGQLGYTQTAGSSQTQFIPRKVTSIAQGHVTGVAATNSATAILVGDEVTVLAQFETKKVIFSLPPIKNVSICKIVSGSHQFAAVSKNGDVFLWSPPEDKQYKDTWQQQHFPQSKPKRIWSARKSYLAARDVAIGIDSTVLICTESGAVYGGTRRKDFKVKELTKGEKETVYFKFTQLPLLRRIVSVHAGISGAYVAIRNDLKPDPIKPPESTLRDDLRTAITANTDAEFVSHAEAMDKFYDVCFTFDDSGKRIYAHRVILACRSSFFSRIFKLVDDWKAPIQSKEVENGAALVSRIDCQERERSLFIIKLASYGPTSLKAALCYIYTHGHPPLSEMEDEASAAAVDNMCYNLDSVLEFRMLTSASKDVIESLQNTLKKMQTEKHPFTRGENGYFAQIRQRALKEEEEAKQRRREEYKRKAAEAALLSTSASPPNAILSSSADSFSASPYFPPLLESQSLLLTRRRSSNLASNELDHEHEIPTKKEEKMVTRGSDENIFDLELDDTPSTIAKTAKQQVTPPKSPRSAKKHTKKDKAAWSKLVASDNASLSSKAEVPSTSYPPPMQTESVASKMWTSTSLEQPKAKISFLDIMKETESSEKGNYSQPASVGATKVKTNASKAVPTTLSSSQQSQSSAPSLPTTPVKVWSQKTPEFANASVSKTTLPRTVLHDSRGEWDSPIPVKVSCGMSQKERRRSKGASLQSLTDSNTSPPSKSQGSAGPAWNVAWPSNSSPSSQPNPLLVPSSNSPGDSNFLFKRQNVSSIDERSSLLSASYTSTSALNTPKILGGPSKGWAPSPLQLPSPKLKSSPSVSMADPTPSQASALPKTPTAKRQTSISSFAAIQQHQLQMQQMQQESRRSMKKSLARIQIEEKAVQDITEFYRLTSAAEDGEWVVVTTTAM